MLIFITGYMGAGKTTLGKSLAERLNHKFYDLDELVEQATGQMIMDYFEGSGEEAFRKLEREILTSHFDDKDTIIATGGGTACYLDNMDLMNSSGITVFLDTPVEVIINRLISGKHYRPLLRNIVPGDLSEFVTRHLDSRREYYKKAAIRTEKEDIGAILDAVRSFGR
jgi:shikimate kinase